MSYFAGQPQPWRPPGQPGSTPGHTGQPQPGHPPGYAGQSRPTLPQTISFRPTWGMGSRPQVTVTPQAVTYDVRRPNWLTWTVILLTGFLALFAWPWIQWGRRSRTLPRHQITGVDIQSGLGSYVVIETQTEKLRFRTDQETAENVRRILSS